MQKHAGNPDYLYYFVDALSELADGISKPGACRCGQTTLQKRSWSPKNSRGSHPANGYYRHLIADIAYSLASLAYHERHQPVLARPCFRRRSRSSRS